MTRLYTIGYQGASVEGFIAALKAAGVETLIDVRAVPASRRREFSKRNLAASLAAAGLAYGLIIGFGANDWRRAGLARRGWRQAGVVAAIDADAALRRHYDLHGVPGVPDDPW